MPLPSPYRTPSIVDKMRNSLWLCSLQLTCSCCIFSQIQMEIWREFWCPENDDYHGTWWSPQAIHHCCTGDMDFTWYLSTLEHCRIRKSYLYKLSEKILYNGAEQIKWMMFKPKRAIQGTDKWSYPEEGSFIFKKQTNKNKTKQNKKKTNKNKQTKQMVWKRQRKHNLNQQFYWYQLRILGKISSSVISMY